MTTRPMLTQREAAAACGVSRTTIRRRREAGALPNAVEDPQRGWLIPVTDLLAAGFRVNAPAGPDAPAATQADNDDQDQEQRGGLEDVAALRAELERQRHEHALELARARHGRELAEQEAQFTRAQLAAREEHIADLQRTLAAWLPAPERTELPAAVPGQARPPTSSSTPAPADAGSQERRRWWGGRR